MVNEWTEVSLSELTTKITKGTTPTKKDGGFSSEGVNYIKSEAVTSDGRIDESKFTFISSEIHKKLKRSQLEESDILMSMAGIHLGKTAIVRTRHLPANTNQALALIRPIRNKIYPDYLFYFLQQSSVVYFINNSTSQSAQPNINLQEIGSLNIKYPEYNEQKAIAHILGSLDDKIELNRQMNETLEAMAQALFKSWFVDFDPVIDNALAAGNAIPAEFSERAEQRKEVEKKDNSDIQDLFPNEFEFTEEMGWIPKGWAITNLKDHAEKISKGTTPSKAILAKADDDSTIPFLKVRDLDDKGKIDTQNLDLIPKSIHENALKRSILQTGDLLFSIAGTIGRVSIVPKELDNSNSNQALAFIRPKDDIKTYFLLQFLKSQEVQDEISSRVVQAVQANVSLTELGSLKFATASDDLFRKWHSIVQSWIEKINLLQMENSHLSKLRDTLLPKLMSGELRIADAEELVDEAI